MVVGSYNQLVGRMDEVWLNSHAMLPLVGLTHHYHWERHRRRRDERRVILNSIENPKKRLTVAKDQDLVVLAGFGCDLPSCVLRLGVVLHPTSSLSPYADMFTPKPWPSRIQPSLSLLHYSDPHSSPLLFFPSLSLSPLHPGGWQPNKHVCRRTLSLIGEIQDHHITHTHTHTLCQ